MGSSTMIVQFVCLVFLLVSTSKALAQLTVFDITKLGGVADGKTDNSKAFSDAWTQACQNNGGGVVLFPAGTFLVRPVVLIGAECKGRMEVRVQGTVLAATDMASSLDIDHWINFQHVNNFLIGGGGSFDGQGASAWPYNTCRRDPNCRQLPYSLRFDFVTNAIIDHITSINSKNFHINLFQCHDFTIRNVNIKAPGDSPNTDGIHLGMSHHIQILDSVVGTGDDCISLSYGTNNVNISGVQCGPGHGISIGSLGNKPGHVVSAVEVRNSGFVGTQNGLRIKTWGLPNPGSVSQINFEHIQMDKVDNPIIIDQQYCPSGGCSTSQSSGIQVEDVTFNDIRGTGSTPNVVTLKCSKTTPCKKIVMTDINLTNNGKPAVSACSFAEFTVGGQQIPAACTKNVTSIVPHLVKIGRLSNQIHI